MKIKIFKIILTLGIIVSCIFSSVGVSAYSIQKSVVKESYHYVPKVDNQGHFYVPQTTATGDPTLSSGGWTNPTNAYASGGGYADITSGSPSASETYNGFGFTYYGSIINQVRVRTDAYCAGVPSSKIVYPSNDYATATGTWAVYPTSPTTYYDKVNQIISDGDTTYELEGTTAGYRMFGFVSPALNTNVTIQNVTVTITARDNTSGTNKIQPALRVGGTNYLTTSTSTEVPTAYGTISYSYTTNPKTGVAWTVADVNGTGTNPLQDFGTNSADANPQIRITQVNMTVNYTTGTDEKINLYTSWDGGTTWSSAHSIQLTGSQATYWTDVTADTAWTYSKLLDTNFRARVEAVTVGDTSDIRLDYLTTEVTNTAGANVTQIAPNEYTIGLANEGITVGNSTSQFLPVFTLPRWENNDWATSIGMTLAVAGNALASTFTSSSFSTTSGSITAENSYMKLVYSGTTANNGYNETGGMDLNIVLKQNIGTTLSFGYNSTNVNAYLQPSLTQEWTVGQVLHNGNTVASVTDTTVMDNLGNIVVIRPIYVVNSICFMNTVAGGVVSTNQALTGLSTGQIGYLYRMNLISANGIKAYANWSISGSNIILSFDTTGMTYPIQIIPVGDTFGYTTLGGSQSNDYCWQGQAIRNGTSYSCTGGTGVSVSFGGYKPSGNCNVQGGIYDTASPSNFITNSNTPDITVNSATNQWWTGTYITPPTFASANYYVCILGSSGWGGTGMQAYVSGATDVNKTDPTTYGVWLTTTTWHSSYTVVLSIYCTYTPTPSISISNAPTTKDFGTVMPSTTYYAKGTAPNNPVVNGDCTFTITNNATSSVNIAMSCTNATGGNTWTLVTGTPSGDQFKVIAYYSGENPASGLVLTNSNQAFATIAGSGTLMWDFEEILGGTGSGKSGTFSDNATKTYTINLVGS